MAEVNFFDSFGYKWGQAGNADPIQDDQYKLGWSYIGSTPPSVEQFNKLAQLSDEKINWLFAQLKTAADANNVTLSAGDFEGLIKVLDAYSSAFPRVRAFAEVVALTRDEGPIIVHDMCGRAWSWIETPYFAGYRSPMCGEVMGGNTVAPRSYQVLATGGVWRESDQKDKRVIAHYREQGLVCTIADWIPGQNMIADLGGGDWKAPDLQNMFLRMTGTVVDTANERGLGRRQADSMQGHRHGVRLQTFEGSGGRDQSNNDLIKTQIVYGNPVSISVLHGDIIQGIYTDGESGTPRASSENRPVSTAVSPFIHV